MVVKWGLPVQSLHVPSVPEWALSQSKDMYVRQTADSKLAMDVS